jgi:hypothetical protein
LGDDVTVKIWRTNLEKKQLDFQIATKEKWIGFE